MTTTTHPSKQVIRHFMQQRQADKTPPPSPQEIRELLGWTMLQDERKQR